MREHADDKREIIYSLEEMEECRTYDELWNASQREMNRSGELHNYVRMLWGKNDSRPEFRTANPKIDDVISKRQIIIFIILIFIKITREFCDIGKTTRVKLALETPSYMFVFKNSSAEQNRNFEPCYFFSEIFIIPRQSL